MEIRGFSACMRISSHVSLSVFGLLQKLKVLLPFVYFETRVRDWFWSVWHRGKSEKPQGREAVLSWRRIINELKIWFTPDMIYWEAMACVVKSKTRPRVKTDFFFKSSSFAEEAEWGAHRTSYTCMHVAIAWPGTELCQAQRDSSPGGVWSVLRDSQLTHNLLGYPHASKPSSASTQTRALLPSLLCWFTAGMLRCSGNHVVNTVLFISIFLGCSGLASIPRHCSRESIRQGMFPGVRIDESTVLRRGNESLAIWMQASPFALVLTASAMWWMFLLSMRKFHRYNTLDNVR